MIKRFTTILFTFLNLYTAAQDDATQRARPIVIEGKLLYKSEMASWYGTDLFLERYKDRANIGGYFSYLEDETPKCIFFSKTTKVIGTITFDSTYNIKTAKVDLSERAFTNSESELYAIRKIALSEINTDTLFKTYNNSSLNIIPLINGGEKKVYILTGTTQQGVVIFGNDYLLKFDKENNIISKKSLHKNIIPINYGGNQNDEQNNEGAIHSHLPETGEFITATDICTLMLYEKLTKWKQHNVVSKNYLNIWNCITDELVVIPMETIKKIQKDQEKRSKKKNNDD